MKWNKIDNGNNLPDERKNVLVCTHGLILPCFYEKEKDFSWFCILQINNQLEAQHVRVEDVDSWCYLHEVDLPDGITERVEFTDQQLEFIETGKRNHYWMQPGFDKQNR